jgi:hypothetical protein
MRSLEVLRRKVMGPLLRRGRIQDRNFAGCGLGGLTIKTCHSGGGVLRPAIG